MIWTLVCVNEEESENLYKKQEVGMRLSWTTLKTVGSPRKV